MEGNYIKIFRSMLDWEWYGNINTSRLFLHMILKANWKDGKFEGTTVPRGSFISSYPKLSAESGLTVNEVRTALKHLTSTGEITVKAQSKYSIFTIKNYCLYQEVNSQSTVRTQSDNSQDTVRTQSINSLLTTIEEKKEVNKKEVPKGTKKKFTPPTVLEVADYCSERNNGINAELFIDFYAANGWVQGKGKPVQDWKACVRTWEKREKSKGRDVNSVNKFNNFQQRNYDYADLEKQLLNSQPGG